MTKFSLNLDVTGDDGVSSQRFLSRVQASMSNESSREKAFLFFLHGQYPNDMNDSVDTFGDEDDSLFDNFDCARGYFDWEMQPDDDSEARADVSRRFMPRIENSLRKWSTSVHDKFPIKEIVIDKTATVCATSSSTNGHENNLDNFRGSLVKICDAIRAGLNDEISCNCEPVETKPVASGDDAASLLSRIDEDLFIDESSTCSLISFYLRGGCNDSVVIRQRQFSKQNIKEEKKCGLRNSVETVTTAASSVMSDIFGLGASFSTLSVGSISNVLR